MTTPLSERVTTNRRALEQRRAEIANQFRAQLRTELHIDDENTLPASRLALFTAAVSAYLQVSEISRAYECGRASPRAVLALGLARSELRRCLRGLGLVERDDDDDEQQGPTLAEWVERKRAETNSETAP